jgi:hypothetical protein
MILYMPSSEKNSRKTRSQSKSKSKSSEKRKPSRFVARFSAPKKAAKIFDQVVKGPYETMAMQTAMRTVQDEFVGMPPLVGHDMAYEKRNYPGVKFMAHAVMPPKVSPGGKFRGNRYGTRRVQARPSSGNPEDAFRGTRRTGIKQ